MRRPAPTTRLLLLAAALLALPPAARAEGLSLYLEPSIAVTSQDTRDQLGNETHQELRTVSQLYRLSFDRPIGPMLGFSVGGQFEKRDAELQKDTAATISAEITRRSVYTRLSLDLPALTGGLNFDFGDQQGKSAVRLVNESLSGYLAWRPLDLPEVNLRLGQTHFYDSDHAFQDTSTTSAMLAARFGTGPIELKYALQWARPTDALTGTETSAISQAAQVLYGDRLFDDRTTLYASLTLHNQQVTTLVPGTGTIATQQHPMAGLSLVEVFPVVPTDAVLVQNAALVDGDLTNGAAIDLGYALSVAGDQNKRDLGLQFADVVTSVNQFRVWTDRRLPTDVAAAITWSAWRSDDNKAWVAVPITGPVVFDAFQNRFEIPIPETRSRFLKVVTQPLLGGVTTDPAYATILVTELQAFLLTQASNAPRSQATSGAQVVVSASTLLWRAAHLQWDLMSTLERRLSPDLTIWSVLNGLSASQQLANRLQLSERVTRLDGDYGIGRSGQTDWSAGLTWTPVTTFTGTLTYTGEFVDALPTFDAASGTYYTAIGPTTNTLATLLRADLYPGISASLSGSMGQIAAPNGTNTWNESVNASATFIPNPWLSFGFNTFSAWNTVYAWDAFPVSSYSLRLDGNATFRPTQAISATAYVSRILAGAVPTTFGTVQVNYVPLRGDLQLSVAYSKNYDTATQVTSQFVTPGVRWNIRPGVLLTASYTYLDTSSPVSLTQSQSFNLVLSIAL